MKRPFFRGLSPCGVLKLTAWSAAESEYKHKLKMPQGKMKTKTKLPEVVRAKRKEKGPPVSKRGNAPAKPRKAKNAQVQKLKKLITKTVNATVEEELRSIALDGKKSLLGTKGGSPAKSKKNKKK